MRGRGVSLTATTVRGSALARRVAIWARSNAGITVARGVASVRASPRGRSRGAGRAFPISSSSSSPGSSGAGDAASRAGKATSPRASGRGAKGLSAAAMRVKGGPWAVGSRVDGPQAVRPLVFEGIITPLGAVKQVAARATACAVINTKVSIRVGFRPDTVFLAGALFLVDARPLRAIATFGPSHKAARRTYHNRTRPRVERANDRQDMRG